MIIEANSKQPNTTLLDALKNAELTAIQLCYATNANSDCWATLAAISAAIADMEGRS